MIDRIINTKNLEEADVVFLSAPYEGGVSFMGGTRKAPAKIIDCLDNNLELFDIDLLSEPSKKLKTAHLIIKGLNRKKDKKAIDHIAQEYEKILSLKKFPILLGGEHTVSLGALQSVAQKFDPKNITIFQIDAHQDLRDDNSDYSEKNNKYAHSCVMRRVHDLGFKLVQVGIRTFSRYEYEFTQNHQDTIKVFPWKANSPIPNIDEIIEAISTDQVYVSLDVDGIDPSFMPGTGTPVPGGLEWNYTLNLLNKLFEKKEVIGADIVEVSPMRDSVLTEFGAALICYKMMANKFKEKIK